MSEEREDIFTEDDSKSESTGKYSKLIQEGDNKYRLPGMYKNWFLDYASYVILDRAVPHIEDGLKPVQRRILHAMRSIYDGTLIKVATIVGEAMKYHPHSDASIKEALVQMGQKNLLIDCQGNWGNTITGDEAAAARYIEGRLSPFAIDVVFNPKTTEWMNSYDGRKKEPVTLPVKFPLVLHQGADGIAVGLNCKILPHNFNELIDASVAYLKGEEFHLYPDFPSGGIMDVSRYADGKRGGQVTVRARIIKTDKKTIKITELPFGKNSGDICKSIMAANDKGKIKVRKVEDLSTEKAEIVVTLAQGESPDKTIDALYAFTYCQVSLNPNTCLIKDNKPHFMTVSQVLEDNTLRTKELIRRELLIKMGELETSWHSLTLEKIFFEEGKYKMLEEKKTKSWENQVSEIHKALKEYEDLLHQEVTREDVLKLVEKPVRKISRFDIKECNNKIAGVEKEIAKVKRDLANLTQVTIDYFLSLKEKYGDKFPRRTEITNLETIQVSRVAVANAKLYANFEEGFIGMDLKKDDNAQFICNCSDIDDIIVFFQNGKYLVTKITDKSFVGKNIIHVAVFVKNNLRTVYNAIYRDGKNGFCYVKRFAVTAVTRDKEYDITMGTPDSKILWFTANPNGEAESVRVALRPRPKLKKLFFDYDFATLAIKGRSSRGNLLSKNPISRITLKSKGSSTIGDKPLWFDMDVNRLNEDKRGKFLGNFKDEDKVLAVYADGTYCTTNQDLNNHYQGELISIEKFNPAKVYAAVYYDAESSKYYLKRFKFEANNNTSNLFISEAEGSRLVALTGKSGSQIVIQFGGKHEGRQSEIVIVDTFIAEKGWKAKGKRLTQFEVEKVVLIEPPVLEDEEFEEFEDQDSEGPAGTKFNASDSESTFQEGTDQEASAEGTEEETGDFDFPDEDEEESSGFSSDDDEPTLF
ncbi:MAG: DNA gyrase/topoisomerase IV subunit A [Bacteroidales bacterium]|nr:DNA gyrase/topoisomerase IV subunit A [Bacteroidales bacterium]